jgi:hypothetical protein
MAQRSNRRFLNLISLAAPEARKLIRKRAGGIHHGQGSQIPTKAEYICADQTAISSFRLQTRGGPYIPIFRVIVPLTIRQMSIGGLMPGGRAPKH